MFIYSVRASTIRFFGVIALTLSVLIATLVIGEVNGAFVEASSQSIDFGGIKTNDDRVAFISQFGVSVDSEPLESVEFSLPKDFDRIIAGYNEIQRSQGLDLSKYKNKKVTRYTYSVKNYADYDGEVTVNLIVYRSTVIACDISSASPDGFTKPLFNLS